MKVDAGALNVVVACGASADVAAIGESKGAGAGFATGAGAGVTVGTAAIGADADKGAAAGFAGGGGNSDVVACRSTWVAFGACEITEGAGLAAGAGGKSDETPAGGVDGAGSVGAVAARLSGIELREELAAEEIAAGALCIGAAGALNSLPRIGCGCGRSIRWPLPRSGSLSFANWRMIAHWL